MANTILTIDMITREALRILHQKLNFVGSINRQYDSSFAREGAKIGNTLRIREPNQYTVTDGATLSAQDTVERNTSLTVSSQKHVGMNFTTEELTMELDDFSTRIIEPAMAVLAASIESDVINGVINDVYNQVGSVGSAVTFKNFLEGRKALVDNLAPAGNWQARLNTQDNVDLVDALKGLFQDSSEVSKQYLEGLMGKTAGFMFGENTHLGDFTSGSNAGTGYLVNDPGAAIASGDTVLPVDTGTGTLKKGDIITIAGVNRVHPETHVDTGVLQQFVVAADFAGGAGNVTVSPAFESTGAYQNITALPADGAAVTKVGGASAIYGRSLVYAPDFATFATADLIMPQGVDMASRQAYDGISMRIVRDYDINNDKLPCRVDVLYGYKAIRPQLACRVAAN